MAAAAKNMSIPIKLLHEGVGHVVTVEFKNGETYRGHLDEAEDTMNCQMSNVVMIARDGSKTKLELVYLRGDRIKFVVLPDLLKKAPMFKKVQALKKTSDEKKKAKKSRK